MRFGALKTEGGTAINVTAYGAVGNGTADDTTAIQAALGALGANGGGVFFPAGTYKVTTELTTAAGKNVALFGEGPHASKISGATMGAGTTILTTTGGGVRGDILADIQIVGPGIGSTTTGVKPYTGTSFRNVLILNCGTGIDLANHNGISLDPSVEFRACGVGTSVSGTGNMHNLAARYLLCTKGVVIDAHRVNLNGAWFEGCTTREIEIQDARGVTIADAWIEHSRADAAIYCNPGSASYLAPFNIQIIRSHFNLSSATSFLRINQAGLVRVADNVFSNDAAANILVDNWIEELQLERNYAEADDTESDRNVRVPISISGAGRVMRMSAPPDLSSGFGDSPFLPVGGYAWSAGANLLTDSGYEVSVNATAAGAAAPTVTWDTDPNLGSKNLKAEFPAAASSSANYVRDDRSFNATSGDWYTIEFSAKASERFRAFAVRLFIAGAFEDNPMAFIELGTTYRRYRMLWKAAATGVAKIAFYKNVATTNAITLYVDDIAVYAGGVPIPYVPGVTASIAKGTTAIYKGLVGDSLEIDGALDHDGTTAGFFGTAPITKPSAYTQTYATADKTLAAYTPDAESAAYTGALDGEAKLADLNALRVAYENLRAFTEDLAQHHNSLLDDLQALGLVG
jgi:hypothetical protein